MEDKTKNIAFLFGAGISIKAGMPKTSEIINKITNYNLKHTNGVYSFTSPLETTIPDIQRVKVVTDFIRILEKRINEYDNRGDGQGKFSANHEDIYYLVDQIHTHLCGKPSNLLVDAFIKQIEPEISILLQQEKFLDLRKLAEEAMNCIKHVVSELLRKKLEPKDVGYLDFIQDAIKKYSEDKIKISTLNHDLLFETYFQERKIPFANGFDEEENHAQRWNYKLFKNSSGKVHLYKLHGSIDWKNLRLLNKWNQDNILIPKHGFYDNEENTNADTLPPVVLIGTTNKITDYHKSIFVSLHHLFYESLLNADRLIVSGYGFKDRVINIRIIAWLFDVPQRKMIVIDPNADGLLKNASVNLGLVENDQTKVTKIKKKIENCDWNTIEKEL